MSRYEFETFGKKNLKVSRSGPEGKGASIRIVFPFARGRWRGVALHLPPTGKQSARWQKFHSESEALGWANEDISQEIG